MSKLPNFILFITDQHRADHLGCYGHPVLKTPHIDQIAAEGVAFDNFYVASPVCMPNRASLMTCRMPSSHGVRANGNPLNRRNVTFVEVLRAAGYETALIGKSHLQNFAGQEPMQKIPEPRDGYVRVGGEVAQAVRSDQNAPFYDSESPAFWNQPDPQLPLPYYGFDHVELVTEHGDGVGGDYPRWLRENAPEVLDQIGAENQLPHDYVCPQAVRTAVPEEWYNTNYIAKRAAAWLEAHKDSDKPFFLMVSWPDPHHPFNPPGHYWDMYSPDDMPVPAAFKQEGWVPPKSVSTLQEARDEGKANLSGMGTIACTLREALEARALTCGMISMIDDGVGHVRAAAKEANLDSNTVTIFTTDHGDHLGDHRLLFKGAEQYQTLTRVPFIWADPEGEHGSRSSDIGQTHDIGTTILERARIEAPVGMQGQPLPVVGGTGRDAAFIQYDRQHPSRVFGKQPRIHTVTGGRWRLSVSPGTDFGELYDLENDPDELFNRFDDPQYASARAEMMHKLAVLEMATMDHVPLPTGTA